MRVLSANVAGGARAADVSGLVEGHVDLVTGLKPHIVLFQEAARELTIGVHPTNPRYPSASLRDLGPEFPLHENSHKHNHKHSHHATDRDLLGRLAHQLPDYQFFFAPAIQSNRDSHPAKRGRMKVEEGSVRAQGVATGLRRDSVKLLDFWTGREQPVAEPIELPLPLPEGETIYRGDRNSEPRIAQGLLVEIAGVELQVWNVHLTTLQGEREGSSEIDSKAQDTRSAQLDVLFGALRAREEEKGPTRWILGGDFNSDWEEVGRMIVARRPAAEMIFAGPTRPNTPGGDPRPQADNILTSKGSFSIERRQILIAKDSADQIGQLKDREAGRKVRNPPLEFSTAHAHTIQQLIIGGVDHFPLLVDLGLP